MTSASWEALGNQAVAATGVIYFLAFLAYLAQWASLRKLAEPEVAEQAETVTVGGSNEQRTAGRASGQTTDLQTEGRGDMFARIAVILTSGGAVAHLVAVIGRGMAADPKRVPWGNMYEFTLTGSFVVVLIYLALYRRYSLSWLGPLVLGFDLSILMVAVIWLYEPIAPLTEALNSPWLVIHVVAAMIATGAFTVGGLTSVVYLIKERKGDDVGGYLGRVPSLIALDRLAYRVHAFAFPVWTFAVLIAGPIWAHQAWSRYWNWDPKEVWALITWIVYAGYLHARTTAGWRGRKAAILALIGVATLWFNFIGVNYFVTSDHSYAAPADPADPAIVQVDHAADLLRGGLDATASLVGP